MQRTLIVGILDDEERQEVAQKSDLEGLEERPLLLTAQSD